MAESAGVLDESTGDYERVAPRKIRLEIGAISHRGLSRENNEDSYLAARLCPTLEIVTTSLTTVEGLRRSEGGGYLLIVADGMGGVEGGERASALAVETIEEFVRNGSHLERGGEVTRLDELKGAIEQADRTVLAAARDDAKLNGMGTTLTMAFGFADTFNIVHVGDSRAYHFSEGTLRQITTDHTYVQGLVNAGLITALDARTHPKRNVVTNVVGGPEEGIYIETHRIKMAPDDLLLLCSDGLSEPVDDATIATILQHETDPQAAAQALLEKALEGGGPDNVTVLIAKAHLEG